MTSQTLNLPPEGVAALQSLARHLAIPSRDKPSWRAMIRAISEGRLTVISPVELTVRTNINPECRSEVEVLAGSPPSEMFAYLSRSTCLPSTKSG